MSQRHDEGVALLNAVLYRLKAVGFRKARVDTWANDATGVWVRHHYSAGVWELTAKHYRSDARSTVSWNIHQEDWPAVGYLVNELKLVKE